MNRPTPDPIPLPASPSLEHLHKLAKRLRSKDVPLHQAQLVIARQHGFASWPRLVRHVELVTELSRRPGAGEDRLDSLAEFCVKAVLVYGQSDGPRRWEKARQLLRQHPDLTRSSIHAAAAAADHGAIAQHLAADPAAARDAGGPLGWEPLLYLCYSRLDPQVPVGDVVTSAGLLLQAGADPNAGYLWYGLPTPFTALTGVFGHGEQGTLQQPAHPHTRTLARLLLEAGADPNDGQALYNRMFEADNSHLELLLQYGLGTGDGGPWRRRLPEVSATPQQLLAQQLGWAAAHGMDKRIALLAPLLADFDAKLPVGTMRGRWSLTDIALYTGHPDTARLLVELGAPPCTDPVAVMVDALLSADEPRMRQLSAADPALLQQVRELHPSLVLRATVSGRIDAVNLLVANGFDVNARGRSDLPIEQEWETALHHAAANSSLDLARRLLELGADRTITDTRFGATPLGWAEHFGRTTMIELLAAQTSPDS